LIKKGNCSYPLATAWQTGMRNFFFLNLLTPFFDFNDVFSQIVSKNEWHGLLQIDRDQYVAVLIFLMDDVIFAGYTSSQEG
jgi:hypothetical protein